MRQIVLFVGGVDMPCGGSSGTVRLEREGFWLPCCGPWTLSCRLGVGVIRSDFTGMKEALLRRG